MSDLASYSPPPTAGADARKAYRPARLGLVQRLAMVAAGSVLVGLLVTAWRLTPNPYGMGTHQQLGLPPCTIVQWFDMPCPSCGMTTSWSHMMRGHVVASFQANAGGALLALVAIGCGPWLVVSGLRGCWTLARPREIVVLAVGVTIVVVTLTNWTLRIWN
jgi:hypothetical protein